MRANTGLTMLNDALAGKILFFYRVGKQIQKTLQGGLTNTENFTGWINKYRKLDSHKIAYFTGTLARNTT